MRKQERGRSRSARWQESYKAPREGEWFIAGLNGVRECLASPRVKVLRVWVDSGKSGREARELLHSFQGNLEEQSSRETPFGPLSQGLAALVRAPHAPDLEDFLDHIIESGRAPFMVALDQVEDPMNLGQILRTCEGAGVDGLLLLKHRSVHLNQTVAQVSQGAFAWVPVFEVTNLRNSLELLKGKGLWAVGCEGGDQARPWHEMDFREPVVVVMGAEGKGLRDLTRKTCDHLASLPMRGRLDSLNVGAATSAFLYEAVRQRSSK